MPDIANQILSVLISLAIGGGITLLVIKFLPIIIIHNSKRKTNATNTPFGISMRPPEILKYYDHIKVQEVYELLLKKNLKTLYRLTRDPQTVREMEATSRMAEVRDYELTGAVPEDVVAYKRRKAEYLIGPSYPEFNGWDVEAIEKFLDEHKEEGYNWRDNVYPKLKIYTFG